MDLLLRHSVNGRVDLGVDDAQELNACLLMHLEREGFVQSEAVRGAFAAVRRDLFVPDAERRDVYSDRPVALAEDATGMALSACSSPSTVALMLEAANLEDAHNVLEVGSGSGYSCALIAAASPASVTGAEANVGLARRSRAILESAGLSDRVRILEQIGAPTSGSETFDRVIITCAADDMSPEWVDVVADGGIVVIPVGQAVFRLVREGDRLIGSPIMSADFVPSVDSTRQCWRAIGGDWSDDSPAPARVWSPRLVREDIPPLRAAIAASRPEVVGHERVPATGVAIAALRLQALRGDDYFHWVGGPGEGWGFGLFDRRTRSIAMACAAGDPLYRHYRGTDSIIIRTHGDRAFGDVVDSLIRRASEWTSYSRLRVTARHVAGKPSLDWRIEAPGDL